VPLSTFEIIAVAYFVAIGLLCPFAGAPPRRAGAVSATAFVLAASIVVIAQVFGTGAREWIPPAYLVAGYWLPALVVTARPAAFDAAFIVIYMNGSTSDVNRFWTAVLAAGFACYVSLPWVVSRPPRCLEDAEPPDSAIRSINVRLLDRFSHGWNTFPSGHVAIAIAAALSTMSVAPRAGSACLVVAIGILAGAVSGRYHYAVDAVAGAVVGIAAFAMALRI
jgi:membrane-associated phospholipid phosphatase